MSDEQPSEAATPAPAPPQAAPGWAPVQPPPWQAPGTPAGGAYGLPPGTPPLPPPPPPGWGQPGPPPYGPGGYPPPPGAAYAAWAPPPPAPKPGIVPLRPLGVGEVLDGAVTYIRRDPRTVLGISVGVSLVLALLQLVTTWAVFGSLASATSGIGTTDDPFSGDLGAGSLIGPLALLLTVVLSFLVNVVATGLLTTVVGQAVLGRRVTAGEAWRLARPRLLPLVGLTLLVGVALAGLVVVGVGAAVLLGVLVGQADATAGVLVGLVLGVAALVVTVWLYVRWLLAPASLILERVGPVTAMRRSARLVKGSWWRILGISLLATILAYIVTQVVSIPFTLIGTLASTSALDRGELPPLYLFSVSVATLLAGVITVPFTAGVTALLYVDQRIRREALDLVLQRAAGVQPVAPYPPAPGTYPPSYPPGSSGSPYPPAGPPPPPAV